MFDNIGKKIMTLASALCILGILASVIAGLTILSNNYYGRMTGIGCAVLFGGSLVSWLGSFALYAFGQMVDDIHAMRVQTCGVSVEDKTPTYKSIPSIKTSASDKPKSFIESEGWQCICGRINSPSAVVCANCFMSKEDVMKRKHPAEDKEN